MQAGTDVSPSAGGSRLPLAIRIFLLFAFLLGLAIGAAVFVTYFQGSRIANESARQALTASGDVQREFAERRLEETQLKATVIASDPSFVKYVSDAQGGGLGLGADPILDATSLSDLLGERQESYRFDLGVLLDDKGKVLARTDEAEALDETLGGDPFVSSALDPPQPISGYWLQKGKLYQATIYPLAQDQYLAGFLIVALAVDDALAQRIGKVSGADIAFLMPQPDGSIGVVGTSLDADAKKALEATLAAGAGGLAASINDGQTREDVKLSFGDSDWLARLSPVDADGGPRLGSILQLSNSSNAMAMGYQRILRLVGVSGLIFLLAALPLSFVLAKATLKPLSLMAKGAQEAAAGNYQTHIGLTGNDELAQLSQAFDSLLSDLREKNDIQGYVTNLSRFLPDPGQEQVVPSFVTQKSEPEPPKAPPLAPPVRENLVLLAIDLRHFGRLAEGLSAESAVKALAEAVARVARMAKAAGGQVLDASGPRLIAGFSGEHRLVAALHLAYDALKIDPGVALAVIEGEVAHGGITIGDSSFHTLVGPAFFHLERLLGESGAGHAVLPRTLGERAKALLGADGVAIVAGAASGKPFYGLTAAELEKLPPLPPDVRAELEADTGATVEQPIVGGQAPSPAATAAAAARTTKSGELVPGMRFGGRYEILSVLGQGGMGVVYKARDVELDDVVALKMLLPAALADSEHLERLKSEIKLARRITHPNVLRTFDFGEHDGRPYISMEYVRGMTLRYLLKQAGRIPYSAALRIARQLCAGLGAAHEVGVLHRDIKPENLILEQSGNAKLMDFGIARPIRRSEPGQTQPGMYVGTPHYSSPEQLAGDEVDARADIFASGVLLCEMFCGRLPFTGANTMEIYLAQMQATPIKPSEHWPEIPPMLEAIILKCIERAPGDRYQTVDELGAALSQLRA